MTPKTRQLVPDSAAPSPSSGKRTTQAHPARAAYSTNHVKFMVPLEWRPSIPIENVGSSKQNGRSYAGNNEKRSQTTRSPDHQTLRGQRKILRKPTRERMCTPRDADSTIQVTPWYKNTADHLRSHRPSSQFQPWQFNCTYHRPNSWWVPPHTSPYWHKQQPKLAAPRHSSPDRY